MSYPQMVEYNEAGQNPRTAFTDTELKHGRVAKNNLGLPLVESGGFALTYRVTTKSHTFAVRCFHRQMSSVEERYDSISRGIKSLSSPYFVKFSFQSDGIVVKSNFYPVVKM